MTSVSMPVFDRTENAVSHYIALFMKTIMVIVNLSYLRCNNFVHSTKLVGILFEITN